MITVTQPQNSNLYPRSWAALTNHIHSLSQLYNSTKVEVIVSWRTCHSQDKWLDKILKCTRNKRAGSVLCSWVPGILPWLCNMPTFRDIFSTSIMLFFEILDRTKMLIFWGNVKLPRFLLFGLVSQSNGPGNFSTQAQRAVWQSWILFVPNFTYTSPHLVTCYIFSKDLPYIASC